MRKMIPILASILVAILMGTSAQIWATRKNYTLAGAASLQARMELQQPRIVLLGNSILQRGVDDARLSNDLGISCMSIYEEGAASAWWYLALKNVVAPSTHKPDHVFVLFRDHYLTAPTFRTQGKFKEQLDMLRLEHEPLLEELSNVASQTAGLSFLNRTWPFYRVRYQYRRALDRRTQSLVASFFGLTALDLANLTEGVFSIENLDQELYTRQQVQAETAEDTSVYAFDSVLSRSYLPAMLDLAQEHQLELTFIRFKRRRDVTPGVEPPELVAYMEDLGRYLRAQGSQLIDFTHDPRLVTEDYADGDHLGEEGRLVFTEMLAGAIRNLQTGGSQQAPPSS